MSSGIAWFQYPQDTPGGSYGQIVDPLGAYLKPDVNIAVPAGVPITSLTSGIVTDVSERGPANGGLSVVVAMTNPINTLATHVAYNYLGSAVVSIGQSVTIGTEIGVAGSKYGTPLAIGLTPDNTWGGPHFNLNATGNAALDPHLLLNPSQYPGSNLLNVVSGGPFGPVFVSVSNQTHAILNNVPGFAGLSLAVDNIEQFVPFKLVSTGGQDVGILGHLPFVGGAVQAGANLVTLPQDTIQALLTFVTANTMAFVIRAIIVFVGIVIIMALVRNAIDAAAEQATGMTATEMAQGAARSAVMGMMP